MRACLAVLVLVTLVAEHAAAQSNGILGCDRKDADPQYCRDGKRRPVCSENGHVIWRDTRDVLSQGELHFLAMDGPPSTPPCAGKPGG